MRAERIFLGGSNGELIGPFMPAEAGVIARFNARLMEAGHKVYRLRALDTADAYGKLAALIGGQAVAEAMAAALQVTDD